MGFAVAHKRFGKLPWKDLFEPTIKLCRDGFPVSNVLAKALKMARVNIKRNAALSKMFINSESGDVYPENGNVNLPDLANTLEIVATKGVDAFYKGELTAQIVREINDNGGNVTEKDLNEYEAVLVESDEIEDRLDANLRIFGPRPPSSSPLVSFILKVANGGNLRNESAMSKSEMRGFYHRLNEALKFAYAERSYFGDLDFNKNLTKVIEFLLRLYEPIMGSCLGLGGTSYPICLVLFFTLKANHIRKND
jgi:gamma-glutamyltranspeptidase/glutathione hydrolase/leukotriene-C4 hydrolase